MGQEDANSHLEFASYKCAMGYQKIDPNCGRFQIVDGVLRWTVNNRVQFWNLAMKGS